MKYKLKYTKKEFNKDLKDLTSLINQYKGGNPVSAYDPHGLKWNKVLPDKNLANPVNSLGLNQPNMARATSGSFTGQVTGAVTGGKPKRSAKRSATTVERRSFTIVEVDSKKIPQGEGRYTCKSTQARSSADRKACSRALAKRNKNKLKIKVRETTAGSNKDIKCYNCQRTKLKKPIEIKRKGSAKPILINFETTIKEVTK